MQRISYRQLKIESLETRDMLSANADLMPVENLQSAPNDRLLIVAAAQPVSAEINASFYSSDVDGVIEPAAAESVFAALITGAPRLQFPQAESPQQMPQPKSHTLTAQDSGTTNETATASSTNASTSSPAMLGVSTSNMDHAEPIPDFATVPTILALKSGNWSDASNWQGNRLPNANDVVLIPAGAEVTYDSTTGVAKVLAIHGTLRFATDRVTSLRVATMQVTHHGTLEVGTENSPITANAEIIIRDQPLDLEFDPEQYGTGLIVEGTIRMRGLAKTSFERLTVEPLAGAMELVFDAPLTGWQAGDRLFLPDSRQLITDNTNANNSGPNYVAESETVTIQSVFEDGLSVTLSAPLKFNHFGARDGDGVLQLLPHVANMTRNVTIRSENPAGTRGHTMYTEHADVDIQYASFLNLGRTTTDPINSTKLNADGSVKVLGTNQIGRYAVHIHHLDGPHESQANGYQYTLAGNVIDGGNSVLHNRKWGLALHDSHYGLIQNNTIINFAGAGLVTEDGTESHNVIDHNFIARIWGNGGKADSDREMTLGSGMWLSGVNNYVTNNVVTNVFGTSGTGVYAYNLVNRSGMQALPSFQGSESTASVDANYLPLLAFDGNEAYGTMKIGLAFWNIGASGNKKFNDGSLPSWVRNFTAWHFSDGGVLPYSSEKVNFNDLTLYGDYFRFRDNLFPAGIGYQVGDYTNAGAILTRFNIQNMGTGINPSTVTRNQPQIFRDGYLRNEINFVARNLYSSGGPNHVQPRQMFIDNTVFAMPNVPALKRTWVNIKMWYVGGANVVMQNELYVTKYNGVEGDDFQVFFLEQHPDFIVPQTLPNRIGAPEAGLTNQQNWEQSGSAIAGSIAPSLETRPGIIGFVAAPDGLPLGLDPLPPVIVGVTNQIRQEDDGTFSVSLRWITNRPTTFLLSESKRNGLEIAGTMLQTVHEVTIRNLTSANTLFRFKIKINDQFGSSSMAGQLTLPKMALTLPMSLASSVG